MSRALEQRTASLRAAASALDSREKAITFLRDAHSLVGESDQFLGEAARAARHAGCTWQDVGDVVGTTRQAAFPEAEIPNAWAQIIAQVGELETIADDAYVRVHAIQPVVDAPLEFEAGSMVGRVTFDESGHVAGLFFLNPDAASESKSQ